MIDGYGVSYGEAPSQRNFSRKRGARPLVMRKPRPMGPALPPSMWSPQYRVRCARCRRLIIAGIWAGQYLMEDCPGCGRRGDL